MGQASTYEVELTEHILNHLTSKKDFEILYDHITINDKIKVRYYSSFQNIRYCLALGRMHS